MDNVFEIRIVNKEGKEVNDTVLISGDWTFSLSGPPMPVTTIFPDIPTEGVPITQFYQMVLNRTQALEITDVSLSVDFEMKNIKFVPDKNSDPKTESGSETVTESVSPNNGINTTRQASLFDEDAILAPSKEGGQFSLNLFDDEPGTEKPGENTCGVNTQKKQMGKDSATAKMARKYQSKEKPLKIESEEWRIAYAGQIFHVTEFFHGVIPEGGLTLEQIREAIELDFPEFSKERTYWEHDKEKKLLVPIIRGTSKGALK